MRHVKLSRAALKQGKSSFQRCGVPHTKAGATFEDSAFTAAEWARLAAEPMLEVSAVDGPVPGPEDELAAFTAAVRAAIATLGPEEFTRAGAPQLGAVRAALPEDVTGLTREAVDTIWAAMAAEGVTAPQAAEGTDD
ncbi:MAG: hypothetical protein KDA73_10625 [Rhodobacteraceae bacterium]|nr:hypothetical protein [Paracoccaceae bacterium]